MRKKSVPNFVLMIAALIQTCAVRQPVFADDNTVTATGTAFAPAIQTEGNP